MKHKLTKSEQQQLMTLLDHAAQEGGLNYWQSQGFLTHIQCFPRTLDPSGWASAIAATKPSKTHWPFKEQEMDMLFVLYNQIHHQLHQQQQLLPSSLDDALLLLQQRQLTQPFRNWCAGFVYGWRYLFEQWQELLTEPEQQQLKECVDFIGYVATLGSNEPYALEWQQGAEPEPEPQTLLAIFEDSLKQVWLHHQFHGGNALEETKH